MNKLLQFGFRPIFYRLIPNTSSIRFIVSILFIVFSMGFAFSISVTSIPKTEIAEGQFYSYKLQLDKTLASGSFAVNVIPSWLTFNASSQVFSGIANANYGANAVKITITDGSNVIIHNFTINLRRLNELPKIMTDYVDPTKYPEFKRRKFPTPPWKSFNDTVRFTAGRHGTNFQWENTLSKFGPKGDRPIAPAWLTGYGNVFSPNLAWFGTLSSPDVDYLFQTAMTRLKNQGIYLFDIGGYTPLVPFKDGGMFKMPDTYRDALQSKLGDKFLGFDIGEQDGRYLSGLNRFNQINSNDRFHSYLNFHNYIQRMSDDLGNKINVLSVRWGWNYVAKNNNVYMVGAESQPKLGVTNVTINYMMQRGVSRTYGIPLFGNVSVFCTNAANITSFKDYGVTGTTSGPTKGNSLNSMRRMMFSQYLYNAAVLGFEGNLFEKPFGTNQVATPIAEIQKQMYLFVQSHPKAGVMHTPVALLQDFMSGWVPKGSARLLDPDFSGFGTNPWDLGDWQTHYVTNKIYPDYDKNGRNDVELGALSNTPFGEMADGLLTDASKEVLSRYGLIVFSGLVRDPDKELKDKILYYLNQGGNMIVTARIAQKLFSQYLNSDDTWISVTNPRISFTAGLGWPNTLEQSTNFVDTATFLIKDKLSLPAGYQVLASSTINAVSRPIIVRVFVGKGSLDIDLSEYGINSSDYAKGLLSSYSQLLSMELSKQQLFSVGNDQLSFITNRIDSMTYTIGIFNNSLTQKTFAIASKIGSIQNVTELDLTMGRTHISSSVGYWPELYQTNNGGTNTSTTIMGGDVRFFKVQLATSNLVNAVSPDSVGYSAFPTNRYLYFPSINNSDQKILGWKTMLTNFEGIMLDWGELMVSDKATVRTNASWLNIQNIKLVVDFSRGFDNYFILLAQDTNSRSQILDRVNNVFDKMQTIFGKNAVNAVFQVPSGMLNSDISTALDLLAKQALKYNINLLICPGKDFTDQSCLSIISSVSQSNPNLKYLLNTSNFSNLESGINSAGTQLAAVMINPENVSKSYVPVQKLNSNVLQIYNFNSSCWDSIYTVLTGVTKSATAINLGISSSVKPEPRDLVGEITDNYKVNPLNSNYYLTFRNITDLKSEVLDVADTLFSYYGGVMLEAKYLTSRDSLSLINDARWLKAKGLKVVVDLSQELNNYPDLCWYQFPIEPGSASNTDRMIASQDYMSKVIDKMLIIGAKNIIIGGHNGTENSNGYSTDQTPGIDRFVAYCKTKSINVHYQNNEYNDFGGGSIYNNSSNVEGIVDSLRTNKGYTNLNFASNSINRLGLNLSSFYYPTITPLGALIIGGSTSNLSRNPRPINLDTRINVGGLINYPNALKILDGGYEINKSTFAMNAGADARYLKRVKNNRINNAPKIVSTPITKLGGGSYNYTIIATDIDKDTLTYRKAILPSWLKFDSVSHIISGFAPKGSGGRNYPVRILVNDGATEVGQSFNITVDSTAGVNTGEVDANFKNRRQNNFKILISK